jgi:hypothetical protein
MGAVLKCYSVHAGKVPINLAASLAALFQTVPDIIQANGACYEAVKKLEVNNTQGDVSEWFPVSPLQ